MGIKCFLCKKKLRSEKFPQNLKFWEPNGYWFTMILFEHEAWLSLCAEHYEYVIENRTIAETLFNANIRAIAKDFESKEDDNKTDKDNIGND